MLRRNLTLLGLLCLSSPSLICNVDAQMLPVQQASAALAKQQKINDELQKRAQINQNLLQQKLQGEKIRQKAQRNALEAQAEILKLEEENKQLRDAIIRSEQINEVDNPSLYFLPPVKVPSDVRPPVGNIVNQRFPLTQQESAYIAEKARQAQAAAMSRPPVIMVNPIVHATTGPDAQVPTIRIAPGYATTLTVVDQRGFPWPVTSTTLGGGSQFDVNRLAPSGSDAIEKASAQQAKYIEQSRVPDNILTISSPTYGAQSNVIMTLQGLSAPVMVKLVSIQPKPNETADAMVTLQIDNGLAPGSPQPVVMEPNPGKAKDLSGFLQNVPPRDAQALKVSGSDIQAWMWKGLMIVRTAQPLRSPAWMYEATLGGIHVYALSPTSVLLVRGAENQIQSVQIDPPPGGFAMAAP